MSDLNFEPAEKRYNKNALPIFCYRITSGEISDKSVTVTPNWHNDMEILCSNAELILYIGDKRYDVLPGDIFFINPKEIHRAFRKSYGSIISIVFDLNLLKTPNENDKYNLLIDEILQGKKKFKTKAPRDSELYREMSSFFVIVEENAYKSIGLGREKYRMLAGLYLVMDKCIEAESFEDSCAEKQSGMRYAVSIVNYIENHYSESLTAENLSEKFNISSAYLYSLFKNYVGITPLQYINSIRLREAYRLLDTGANVTETAMSAGFSDASYFIKVFKAATGKTPLQWRKNAIKEKKSADKN